MAASWFIIVVCLAACVVTIALLRLVGTFFQGTGHAEVVVTRHGGAPHRRSRFLSGVFAGVIGCIVLAGAVMMLHVARSGRVVRGVAAEEVAEEEYGDVDELLATFNTKKSYSPEPIPVTVPRETTENLPPAEPELGTRSASASPIDAESLKVTVFEPGATDGTPAATLPDWTSQSTTVDGLPRVIQTGPHATAEGAEAATVSLLAGQLSNMFIASHPEAAGWIPPTEVVQNSGVIARRAIQEHEVIVGEFAEPVFQFFLEVVPPENLDARLFTAWRADTLNSRLLLVGGGMGLLTLMFGSLAGYFRLDDATRGKYRKQLRIGTAALWVAAGSALAFVA